MAFWTYPARPTVATEPTAVLDPATFKAEMKHAYDRGRADERVRHRGSGLLAVIVVVVAAMGIALMALAAREGSFSGGGAVVDAAIAQLTGQASRSAVVATPSVTPVVVQSAAPSVAQPQDAGATGGASQSSR
jgi:hypothetical protein